LTEYCRDYAAIRASGADVVALSVDPEDRSEPLRRQLGIEFPILCDTGRRVVREWGLYNPDEMGGIAIPAVFVIGTNRRVLYRSIDNTSARVSTEGVLRFLQGSPDAAPPERRPVRPRPRDFARAVVNAIRRGVRVR
jgi:peroxiredoxin